MTDPKLAVATEWGRMYARERGGQGEVPSITTVLGVLDQDMGWWEALCATREAIKWAPRLAEITTQKDSWGREQQLRKATTWIKETAERDRDAAASRGDLVHDYAEKHALRILGHCDEGDVASARADAEAKNLHAYLDAFHDWWREYKPQPLQPEATIWNHAAKYAGTTDLICTIGGSLCVVDYKTKKDIYKRNGDQKMALRPYTGMQLAAAAQAEEMWVPARLPGEADRWVPWPYKVEVGLGVAIAPDGCQTRQFDIWDPVTWESFTALRRAWEFYRAGPSLMSAPLRGPESITPLGTQHPIAI